MSKAVQNAPRSPARAENGSAVTQLHKKLINGTKSSTPHTPQRALRVATAAHRALASLVHHKPEAHLYLWHLSMAAAVTTTFLNAASHSALAHVGLKPLSKLAPVKQYRRPSVDGLPWHVRKQVLDLLHTFLSEHNEKQWLVRSPKRIGVLPPLVETTPKRTRLIAPAGVLPQPYLTRHHNKQRASLAEQENAVPSCHVAPAAPSFEAVLRVYYRGASARELEPMLEVASSALEEIKRRSWIAKCRANATEQIRQAFMVGDENCDGKLSLNEFCEALKIHRGDDDEESSLVEMFEQADSDGDGSLDLPEFLELVSRHPELRRSFDHLLKLGCTKRMALEDHRSAMLFRQPVSPDTRTVRSPSGRRRRPSLLDLRSEQDISAADRANRRNIRNGSELIGFARVEA